MLVQRAQIEALLELVGQTTDPVTGFLPPTTPAQVLPSPYTKISEAVRSFVPHYHGEDKDIRPWLDSFFREVPKNCQNNLVPHSRGDSLNDWDRAVETLSLHQLEGLMTMLSLLCHAYRWQCMPTTAAHYEIKSIELPVQLERLWTRVAERLQVPRVGIFYTMISNNWSLPGVPENSAYDPADLTYGQIELLHPWLQGQEYRELYTFIATALEMEAQGIGVLRSVQRVLRGLAEGDALSIELGFTELHQTILKLQRVFNQNIKLERMKPGNFLKLIQPTMIWLIDGIEGANGPQCCTIQLMDSVLGVPRESLIGEMIQKSRHYMLPKHQRLLNAFDEVGPIIRQYMTTAASPSLQGVYSECLRSMVSWRVSHQKRGGHYLKGDPAEPLKYYTSTGLLVTMDPEATEGAQRSRVEVFESAMQAHINQTRNQILTPERLESPERTSAPDLAVNP